MKRREFLLVATAAVAALPTPAAATPRKGWLVNYSTMLDWECHRDDRGYDTVADLAFPCCLLQVFPTIQAALDAGEQAYLNDTADFYDGECGVIGSDTDWYEGAVRPHLTREDTDGQRVLLDGEDVEAVIIAKEVTL